MLRVPISIRLLKMMIDYSASKGEQVEIVQAYGDPDRADLRFFKRDTAVGS